jgi:hypothetical protein
VYHDTAIQSEVSAKLSKKTYETEEEKEKEMGIPSKTSFKVAIQSEVKARERKRNSPK